jgi:PKHD-type hydroxylase
MTAIGTNDPAKDVHKTHLVVPEFLDEIECKHLIDLGKRAKPSRGTVDQQDAEDTDYRKCTVSWLRYKQITEIWESLCAAATNANLGIQVDLDSAKEKLQFATYDRGDYFRWHYDLYGTRKLTAIILLNNSFKGGEFQQMLEPKATTINMKPGDLLLFPSYLLHRVTKIKKGTRHSLTAWIHGRRLQ